MTDELPESQPVPVKSLIHRDDDGIYRLYENDLAIFTIGGYQDLRRFIAIAELVAENHPCSQPGCGHPADGHLCGYDPCGYGGWKCCPEFKA